MIKITIEGPQAADKTCIGNALRDYLDYIGMTHLTKNEATEAAIEKHKPDVLIEERTN